MMTIADRLSRVRSAIRDAEWVANRDPGSVTLLAVSKTKPAADLAVAYACGQRHFGESYLQEAMAKQTALSHFDITWHFIGPIQSNKTRLIATHFAWVHSVDRLKIAQRLSAQRPAHLPPLNICLQVNISDESTKSGVAVADLPPLIEQVGDLPGIRLRGVMAIPAPQPDYERQRLPYRMLYQVVAQLNMKGLDTFSLGMSGDLKAAIVEGSTMVRVGSAIFGARSKQSST